MLWAARGEVVALAAVQVAVAVITIAELVLAREAIARLLSADQLGQGVGAAAPQLLAVAALHGVVLAGLAVQGERQRLVGEQTARYTTGLVLEAASSVRLAAFDDPGFHDRLERARANSINRPMQLVGGLLGAGSGIALTVAISMALFLIEPILVLLSLLAVPALLVAARRNTRELYDLALQLTPDDRMRLHLGDLLSDRAYSQEVRAFGIIEYLRDRYDRLYERRLAALRSVTRRRTRRALFGAGAAIVGLGLALGALLWMLDRGWVDLASTGVALLALVALSQRLGGLVAGINNLSEAALLVDDIVRFHADVTAEGMAAEAPDGSRALGGSGGGLTVDRVTFTYPGTDRPVLREVSLEIGPGQVVGLVGENGSGKTTLVKLVCGLYEPDAGAVVLWSGEPHPGEPERLLTERVAVLFQDFAHYKLSALLNIGLGRPQRLDDLAGITRAANQAGASAVIDQLPEGYETVLGREFEGGTDLSAGQWQRVALGRALFRDAELLILDEPAASLDGPSERHLYEEIRAIANSRPVLLVSHRPESLLATDRVYVIDDGMIVESGTHAELARAGGRYASLFGVARST